VETGRTRCDIQQDLAGTKARIAEAALETLKARGFAGARAREIARTGGFNQALLLYHFGSVHNALLAALELVSNRRVRAYEPAFKNARTVSELAGLARDTYTEDLANGYVTVLGEMVSSGVSDPGLGLEEVARLEPWIGIVEREPRALLIGSVSESMVPPGDLALAIIARCIWASTRSATSATVRRRSRCPSESVMRRSSGRCRPSPRTEKR
jgi:AcrR family transcriptional regulator